MQNTGIHPFTEDATQFVQIQPQSLAKTTHKTELIG